MMPDQVNNKDTKHGSRNSLQNNFYYIYKVLREIIISAN